MALSAGTQTPELTRVLGQRSLPQKGSTTIFQHGLVMIDSGGYAKPGAVVSTAYGAGRAKSNGGLDRWTNDGGDGDSDVEIETGVFGWKNKSGDECLVTDYGKINFIYDDETVARTSDTGARSPAGRTLFVEGGRVYTLMSPEVGKQATELVPSTIDLASTANGEGASLVGIEDAGALLAAADVEAALAEVVKKANAGLSMPMYAAAAYLSLCSAGQIVATFTANGPGKIDKVAASMRRAATTTDKSAIFGVYISDQAVSGGLVTIATTAASQSLGAALAGSTVCGHNAYVAGQVITIRAITVSAQHAEGEAILELFGISA